MRRTKIHRIIANEPATEAGPAGCREYRGADEVGKMGEEEDEALEIQEARPGSLAGLKEGERGGREEDTVHTIQEQEEGRGSGRGEASSWWPAGLFARPRSVSGGRWTTHSSYSSDCS
nr:uncharacterized protein LOC124223642 [Neodiprion pinetum]